MELVGEPGPLLGVIPGAEFTSTDFVLRPGQTILLHTDGVTEGRRDREFFGEARLNAILGRHRGASAALADEVLDEVLAFQNGNARDDIALLIVGAPGDADA